MVTFETAAVNGVELRYLDRGEGPLVLLLHGFPEFSYSWREQVGPLSAAGYRVVAPDLRGYGGSSVPEEAGAYTYFHLIGDLVGLMDHLGHQKAAVVGHDMGSYVAWHMALTLPGRVHAVAGLSVPFRKRPPVPPLALARRAFGPDFYQLKFQEMGVVEPDLEARVEEFLPGILVGLSADGEDPARELVVPAGTMFADLFPAPEELPGWLAAEDVAAYVEAFRRSGFVGPLNWYRNIDRNWELMAPWANEPIRVPALYAAGELDLAYRIAEVGGTLEEMKETVPDLRRTLVIPDCGHWLNQERPEVVNEALLELLGAAVPVGSAG
jgi:pimeloyl-ACP methyl ester carboxylesterase